MKPDAATFQALCKEDYTKLFGRPVASMDVELTVWSVNATTPPESVAPVETSLGDIAARSNGTRQFFDAATRSFMDAHVIERASMETSQRAHGPVAVTEMEITIIVPASCDAIRQPDSCIDIVIKG